MEHVRVTHRYRSGSVGDSPKNEMGKAGESGAEAFPSALEPSASGVCELAPARVFGDGVSVCEHEGLLWVTSPGLVAYPDALRAMEVWVHGIYEGRAREAIWLLEHPPLYTAGTSANPADLLDHSFPVYDAGRGGQYTYHGPGQRVAYVMVDLRRRGQDVRAYVRNLESWIILALGQLGVTAFRRVGRVGLWVAREGEDTEGSASNENARAMEDKIAAIGVRLRRWVTFHGVSLNVDPDLSHFSGIVPCGIREHGVTSLAKLNCSVRMEEVDLALMGCWDEAFGSTC